MTAITIPLLTLILGSCTPGDTINYDQYKRASNFESNNLLVAYLDSMACEKEEVKFVASFNNKHFTPIIVNRCSSTIFCGNSRNVKHIRNNGPSIGEININSPIDSIQLAMYNFINNPKKSPFESERPTKAIFVLVLDEDMSTAFVNDNIFKLCDIYSRIQTEEQKMKISTMPLKIINRPLWPTLAKKPSNNQ